MADMVTEPGIYSECRITVFETGDVRKERAQVIVYVQQCVLCMYV